MTDERKRAFQTRFDELVLQHHQTWLALAGIATLFLLWAMGRGTLVIHSLGDELDRVVMVRAAAEEASDPALRAHLAPHSIRKYLLRCGWLGPKEYREL